MLADFVLASRNKKLVERWRGLNLPTAAFSVCTSWRELEQHQWQAPSFCLLDLAIFQAMTPPDLHHLGNAVCLFGEAFSTQDELHWLATGIRACCTPELDDERLKIIVDVTSRGGIWVSSHALPQLLQGLQRFSTPSTQVASVSQQVSCLSVLTPQERKIAHLVGLGESNKLIARALNISDHTVKTHLSAIFSKLHLSDRVHLALLVNQDHGNGP